MNISRCYEFPTHADVRKDLIMFNIYNNDSAGLIVIWKQRYMFKICHTDILNAIVGLVKTELERITHQTIILNSVPIIQQQSFCSDLLIYHFLEIKRVYENFKRYSGATDDYFTKDLSTPPTITEKDISYARKQLCNLYILWCSELSSPGSCVISQDFINEVRPNTLWKNHMRCRTYVALTDKQNRAILYGHIQRS